ncbi:MAG: hypothetical protein Ta2E_00070 [Mycoplasmoidaceae bacterium]|nr:MAG: hypothetical protein Ta2E_00070 [Mycoplasmoidaceae bacterium]
MYIFVNDFNKIDKTKASYQYFLILININTSFATLKHINDKTSEVILTALKSMFNKIKGVSLESDEDQSFISKKVLSDLVSCDIDYYVVTE